LEDLTNVDARRAEFRCGHTPGPQDDFTSHEDALTLHEAGHLLYRDGEYAAALTCMERAADRGNLWADRDTVVVRQDLFGAVRNASVPAGTPAGRNRGVVLVVAAVAAAATFSFARFEGAPQTPAVAPEAPARQFSSVVLRPQPDSAATPLGLTAATALPVETASPVDAVVRVKAAPNVDGLLADRSVKFEAPNEEGDWSTAYVPRETSDRTGDRRQLHFNATPGEQLVTTLQSTQQARCVWVFTGTDGSGAERSSEEFVVAPDSAKKVEVPVGGSNSFTVTARSDARAGDCLVVDPRFEAPVPTVVEVTTETRPPRPVTPGPDTWATGQPADEPALSAEPAAPAGDVRPAPSEVAVSGD
jgi:hypothetical protein